MIDMNFIRGYFPQQIRDNAQFSKDMLKEYIQFMILDFISTTPYARKLAFIGGTNLRLIKGIDRFSENLDFDCKNMSKEEFMTLTDDILVFLQRSGLDAVVKDRENEKLTAYRRNIYFPRLLFDLGLTGHRDQRFLVKIEAQDQEIEYTPEIVNVKGCGFFFPLPVPPDDVLCAMKLSALLKRSKGRDFYDAMFLLGLTQPNYVFLQKRIGIGTAQELKTAVDCLLKTTNLSIKKKDFEHLLFNNKNSDRILLFKEFFNEVIK
ncbi:MAG: nucleotidyl transferase AbiEii/AbiGii toxin family protein [Bacteroidaceae bacterium]|nr:nucleotidyl transferase AbiEii/AbiGii toxin family protein [Bacteroidaceae bacterium]